MTQTRSTPVGRPRPQLRIPEARKSLPRLYSLDGGYVVLHQGAASHGAHAFETVAAEWNGYRVIAITSVPHAATDADLEALGHAAQAFDRVLICHSCDVAGIGSAETAARFARAVRRAGRTECHVASDAHRALRHCIDATVPGDVIAYCCDDADAAARILAEYGALPVRDAVPRCATDAGIPVALKGATGELIASHP